MGEIDVSVEIVTFLLSLGLGAVICLLYDIIRVMHNISVKGFVEVLVTDLLFWTAATFLTFCFLLIRCSGIVRGYVLVGMLFGFTATRFTVSELFMRVVKVFIKLISAFRKAIRRFFTAITRPVIKILKKFLFVMKKVLQDTAKLLYNQIKYRLKARSCKNGN